MVGETTSDIVEVDARTEEIKVAELNSQDIQPDFPSLNFPAHSTNQFSSAKKISIAGQEIGLTEVFCAYWRFATERQNIFFRRLEKGRCFNLTEDPILSRYKFTNAYRASDRVSQYLIRHVIYRDDLPSNANEVFFRIMLFKLFNKIETWEYLENNSGPIILSRYSSIEYDQLLSDRMNAGERIYSAAYIMPSAGSVFKKRLKHQNHLMLLNRMLEDRFPEKIQHTESMAQGYNLLRSAPSIGPFLAYQFITDLNYSSLTNYSESEFVIPGPGALDGISKCFLEVDKVDPSDIIRYMYDNQEYYFESMSLDFRNLWGRPLQLIDCQNIFCEISKYSRVAYPNVDGISGRRRIKQKFSPRGDLPMPWYPPKWGINSQSDITSD